VLGGNFSRGCRLLSGDDANAVAGNPGFGKAFDGGIRIAAVFEEGRHRVRRRGAVGRCGFAIGHEFLLFSD
jgi:hypothetical protein